MATTPALKTVRRDFDNRVESAVTLYAAVEEIAIGHYDAIQGWEAMSPGHAKRIVGLAFMQMVIAWEDLLENTFVRYVAGAASPNGYTPQKRISDIKSLPHAYQLISGDASFNITKKYLSWSSHSDFIATTKVFLVDGKPYTDLTQLQRERLADAKIIRNRVAHSSQKARDKFVVTARAHLGGIKKLPQGYSVGQLLIQESTRCFGHTNKSCFFIKYAELLRSCADVICP